MSTAMRPKRAAAPVLIAVCTASCFASTAAGPAAHEQRSRRQKVVFPTRTAAGFTGPGRRAETRRPSKVSRYADAVRGDPRSGNEKPGGTYHFAVRRFLATGQGVGLSDRGSFSAGKAEVVSVL